MADPHTRRRFAAAVAAALALVLAAPFVGVIRSEIRAAFPAHFSVIINAAVLLALGAGIVAGLARVTSRRLPRYAAMAAAVLIGGAYAEATASADPAVLAVERFHLIEYGAITFLFFGVWRDRGDWSAVALPFIAAFIVGVIDEAFQWFLPARIGELKDVALNGVAIGCGLLFSLGATPPLSFRYGWNPGSRRLTRRALAVAVLALAGFIHVAHLGVRIDDPEAGSFTSRFTADELAAAGRDRRVAWQRTPPLTRPPRLSREDQYMTEGLQHVQARNRAWEAGDAFSAWRENLILEKYFAPVLETPSYVAKTGHRWSAAHRADAEARVRGTHARPFTSDASPYPIFVWPPSALWLGALALAGALVVFSGDRSG